MILYKILFNLFLRDKNFECKVKNEELKRRKLKEVKEVSIKEV